MKKEKIHVLGEKLGLNKKDIHKTLRNRASGHNPVHISNKSDCYKDGTMYGTVSIYDI